MDQYTPERSWHNDGQTFVLLRPAQRKLFTPWPAGASDEFIRRVASGPSPDPNRINGRRWPGAVRR